MAEVIWTRTGLRHLRDILDYYAQFSPARAAKLVRKLQHGPERLKRFPRSGGRVPEFDLDHIREIIVRKFRILYALHDRDTKCYVVAVIHGSRNLAAIIRPEDFDDLDETLPE